MQPVSQFFLRRLNPGPWNHVALIVRDTDNDIPLVVEHIKGHLRVSDNRASLLL